MLLRTSHVASSFDDWSLEDLQSFRQGKDRQAVVQAVVNSTSSLLQMHLVGQTELATSRNTTTPCLVLSNIPGHDSPRDGLCLPITKNNLKLLSFAVRDAPLTKSVLLGINSLLVNRDDGLFDNLPWDSWTVDPMKRNRDAASNFIDKKFHMGKRDAYNVMMGKDWKGRSFSIGNLAMRAKFMLSTGESEKGTIDLATRILELRVKELKMELAECDYELAIAKQQMCEDEMVVLEGDRKALEQQLKEIQVSSQSQSGIFSILEQIARGTTRDGVNAAPYRGATGYAPLLDSKDDLDSAILPYTSPFDLMKEIIETQLQAQVIGCVLENSSLLGGTLAVGGAVILQRKSPKKILSIGGESIAVDDENEDYGNLVKGGEICLVECFMDEAIGMALASKTSIQVESEIWDRAKLVVMPVTTDPSEYLLDALAPWEPRDRELSFLVEGQAQNESVTEQVSAIRIPRTTTSLFDSLFEPPSYQNQRSSSLFPTENPIQSLDQYDNLDNSAKALTLLSLSNFNGKLPRPRLLRESDANLGGINQLDRLLLPLIDESIRRQFFIRDAKMRGDLDEVRNLESEKSRRQQALELAEESREAGDSKASDRWKREAEFYSGLRADVTQDEGSYSRFLDRDDSYEQNLRALAKRNKKSKFGTLLDGME